MVEKLRALNPLRVCGHPMDAVLYWAHDNKVELFCLPCLKREHDLMKRAINDLLRKLGMNTIPEFEKNFGPCEILSPEQFVERYWKPKGEQQ